MLWWTPKVGVKRMKLTDELNARGVINQFSSPDIVSILDESSTAIYVGFDPTSNSLHIGNLLQIVTMRRLQMAGHKPVYVAGGATGMIGDPSGRSGERNLLNQEELEGNLDAISNQLSRFIDFEGEASNTAVVVNNMDWHGSLTFIEFLRDVGKYFNVSQMLQKDSVRSRLSEGQALSFTEFSYSLLQAYDFLHLFNSQLKVRMQFGGSDQWGNITAGIDFVRRVTGESVYGITTPLVTRSDGRKFGKSEGGAIWLDPAKTSPFQMYQFFVRSEDVMVGTYLRYFTFLSLDEIAELEKEVKLHPESRMGQNVLAREVVALVHGAQEAAKAEAASRLLYSDRISDAPMDLIELALSETPRISLERHVIESGINASELLSRTSLVKSKGEARRTVEQGGLYINDQRVSVETVIGSEAVLYNRLIVLRKGKRDYTLISVMD